MGGGGGEPRLKIRLVFDFSLAENFSKFCSPHMSRFS
jgi:hypothetical protein